MRPDWWNDHDTRMLSIAVLTAIIVILVAVVLFGGW
jgi:hypothetical protein